MYCTNCGYLLSGGERFCPHCGTKVALFTEDPAKSASENGAAFRQPPSGAETGQNPLPGTGSAGAIVPENAGTSPENGNAAGQVYEAERRREGAAFGSSQNVNGGNAQPLQNFNGGNVNGGNAQPLQNFGGGDTQNPHSPRGDTQNPQGQGNAPASTRQQNSGVYMQNPGGYAQNLQDPYGIYDGNPYVPPFFSGANAYQGSNPYLNNRSYGANGSAAFPAGQNYAYGQTPYAQNPYGQGNPQNSYGQNFAAGQSENGAQPINGAGQPGSQPINGAGQQPTGATPQGAAQPQSTGATFQGAAQPNAAGQTTAARQLPFRSPYAPLSGKSFLTDDIFGKNRLTASAYGILFGMTGANCFYLGKMAGAIISLVSFIIGILMQLTWNADVQTVGLLFIFVPEIVNAICGFCYLFQSDEKFMKKIDGSVKLKYLRGLGYRDR